MANHNNDAVRTTNADLQRLSDAHDFDIADGYPDIRGWEVKSSSGDDQKLGKVKDLIISASEMRVRYVDVEVDKSLRASGASADDSHVLLPIGNVQLDDQNDDVIVSGLGNDFSSYPRYSGDQITHEYERSLGGQSLGSSDMSSGMAGMTGAAGGYAAGSTAASTGGDSTAAAGSFYENDRFDDQRAYAKRRAAGNTGSDRTTGTDEQRISLSEEQLDVETRRREAGEVEVRKTIETERVSRSVPVQHEEVTIERRDVSSTGSVAGSVAGNIGQIGDDEEIRIPLMREEVVVETRAVPREEIIIRKRMVTENQTVEADLRRERVQIDGDRNVINDSTRDAGR